MDSQVRTLDHSPEHVTVLDLVDLLFLAAAVKASFRLQAPTEFPEIIMALAAAAVFASPTIALAAMAHQASLSLIYSPRP